MLIVQILRRQGSAKGYIFSRKRNMLFQIDVLSLRQENLIFTNQGSLYEKLHHELICVPQYSSP